MNKNSRNVGTIAGVAVVLCAVAGYVYVQKIPMQPTTRTITNSDVSSVKPPTTADTLTALFGIKTNTDTLVNSENQRSSLWFTQSFSHAKDKFYVVFIKTQTIDPDSQAVLSSHADSANISAVLYHLQGQQWQLRSKQINIGNFGSWGDVPDIKQAQMLTLSPNNTLFLMDSYYTGQGYTEQGKALFNYNFSSHTWKDVGFIQTGGDNAGVCDDNAQPADSMLSACWQFTGDITLTKQGRYPDYPNLLVLHKGTTVNNDNKIVPIGNRTYVFDGNLYTQLATPAG